MWLTVFVEGNNRGFVLSDMHSKDNWSDVHTSVSQFNVCYMFSSEFISAWFVI